MFNIFLIFLVITVAVHCNDDEGEIGIWPNPTCTMNIYYYCEIFNVKSTIKSVMDFKKGVRDPGSYEKVIFSGNDAVLKFIPYNFTTVFSRLTTIEIVHKQLERIGNGDFLKGNNLQNFMATENFLPEIEDYTFEGADNIARLTLYNNKIKRVGKNAFSNLNKLNTLFLDGNLLEYLDENLFVNNKNLNHLSLAINNFKSIDFIQPLTNLRVLSVDHNRVASFQRKLFEDKRKLVELYLDENCLTEFNFETFSGKSLTRLALRDNYLRTISNYEMIKTSGIYDLYIEGNNFNCSYLQEIFDYVGKYKISVINKSEVIPNVMDIRCKNMDSDDDIHVIEDKCNIEVQNLSGKQQKLLKKTIESL